MWPRLKVSHELVDLVGQRVDVLALLVHVLQPPGLAAQDLLNLLELGVSSLSGVEGYGRV